MMELTSIGTTTEDLFNMEFQTVEKVNGIWVDSDIIQLDVFLSGSTIPGFIIESFEDPDSLFVSGISKITYPGNIKYIRYNGI